ncbi:MAG TPA: hypothetical protein VE994_08890 [Terriglobales bacterium]|nr:hypothetical protein [Terriglobales bacterium]
MLTCRSGGTKKGDLAAALLLPWLLLLNNYRCGGVLPVCGVVELGAVELGEVEFGIVELGEEVPVELELPLIPLELAAPLMPVVPLLIPLLEPTVRWSLSWRLPEYDCAMRSAVCLSLAVGTEPLRSMLLSVTVTATFALDSVGSLRRAFSIWLFSWSLLIPAVLTGVLAVPLTPAVPEAAVVLPLMLPAVLGAWVDVLVDGVWLLVALLEV